MYKIVHVSGLYTVVFHPAGADAAEDQVYGTFKVSDHINHPGIESSHYLAYSGAMMLANYLNGGQGQLPPSTTSRGDHRQTGGLS